MSFLNRKNFLPQNFDLWLSKFSIFFKGICILCLSLFFITALFFYSPFDESLNSASSLPIQNKLSWPGSYIADLWMQFFGYASYFAQMLILFYVINIIFYKKKIQNFSFILYGLSSVFLFALFLNVAFFINGGFIAYLLSMVIFSSVDFLNIRSFLPIFSSIIFCLSLFFAFKSFGKTVHDMKVFFKLSLEILLKFFVFFQMGIRKSCLCLMKIIGKPIEESTPERQEGQGLSLTNLLSKTLLQSENKNEEIEDDAQSPNMQIKKSRKKRVDGDVMDNQLAGSLFQLPSFDLLDPVSPVSRDTTLSDKNLKKYGLLLQSVLEEFGIKGDIENIRPGPVVTMYELKPAPGIKTSRVISLADDIARSMSAISARIAVIPGQNVIGIELPNEKRATVYLRDLFLSDAYRNTTASLPIILGKNIAGDSIIADLTRMPHLLVAGTTGSGKSVSMNAMILSLLFKLPPEKCRFIMIDPKMLELSIYDDIPHLLTPVVTDPKKAVVALKWAVKEMENRYHAMSKLGVRNIDGYNARVEDAKKAGELLSRRVQIGFDPDSGKPIFETQNYNFEQLPYIVVVVDEMADLMLVAGKEIESTVQRLAQMARAAGIHVIMATQRPSVDVITGTIKANFPTRISFMVTSKIDSRTILSEQGAEQLLGQGDMLYMAGGGRIQRVHGPFMKDHEVERIVDFLKAQGEPVYMEQVTQDDGGDLGMNDADDDKDPMYKRAVDLIRREEKVSTSFIQRHLSIGYNRAARIVDQMEEEGIISAPGHTGKREIL